MDQDLLRQLRKTHRLVTTADGSEGVPVTLQYRLDAEGSSRAERRGFLRAEFQRAAEEFGVEVDPETVSAVSKTIEGVFPVENFAELVKEFRDRDIRVDIVTDRKLAE
jgi:hypothetical protein